MLSASEALERLQEGNRRFVSGMKGHGTGLSSARPGGMPEDQDPIAIILGCSDARVPAEMVFDQGLGDLFVVRVAGNIVSPSQVGSVEFAAAKYGTPLVVVLGHTDCGAVLATLQELLQPAENQSPNLRSIVDCIRPAVRSLMQTELRNDLDALAQHAVRANVTMSVDHLQHGSEILERLIANGGLMIVGAEYSLETGEVDFFDEVRAPGRLEESML